MFAERPYFSITKFQWVTQIWTTNNFFISRVRHHKTVIECHQNVLQHNNKKKHSSNNFLTSECITDITLFKWRQHNKRQNRKKEQKKKIVFIIFFPSSLEYTLFFIDQNVLYEFCIETWMKELCVFFMRSVSAQVRLMLWSYAIISIVFEVIRYSKVIIIK